MFLPALGILLSTSCNRSTLGDPPPDEGVDPEPITWVANDLVFEFVGADAANCNARWQLQPEPSSFLCESCPFTLDWQFLVSFHWLPEESTTVGCEDSKFKATKNKKYYYNDSIGDYFVLDAHYNPKETLFYLNNFLSWWIHTSDAFGYYYDDGSGTGEYMGIGDPSYANDFAPFMYPAIWDDAGTGFFGFTRREPYGFARGTGFVVPSSSPSVLSR